jgi:hypothetical protein
MSERDTQKAILEWLLWKKVFHWRNNSGAFVMPATDRHRRRFFRAGAVGSPDIFCVRKGKIIGVEVKSEKGRQSVSQKVFEVGLLNAGGIYLLVRSLNEFEKRLESLAL